MAIDVNRQRAVGATSPNPVQQRRSVVTWSPEPQEGGKVFRYNPYHATRPVEFGIETEPDQTQCPEGTRHVSLWGRVSFVQHPSEPFVVPPEDFPDSRAATQRVFFGQLPYFVTDMELNWFTMTFGGGHVVVAPERILKKQASGERLPTGCIHAYATPEAVEAMKLGMHKRILADDTGVWYARSDAELLVLADYIQEMKRIPQRRVHGMPYESVVVELATSRYMPPNPVLLRTPAPPPVSPPPYAAVVPPPPPYRVVVGLPVAGPQIAHAYHGAYGFAPPAL